MARIRAHVARYIVRIAHVTIIVEMAQQWEILGHDGTPCYYTITASEPPPKRGRDDTVEADERRPFEPRRFAVIDDHGAQRSR